MTPSRYVRAHARPRGTPSTPARRPAPRPSPTHHTSPALHARTLHYERAQLHSNLTRTREGPGLNPRCPNCPTNGALHLVPAASACEQLPKAQHLSSSVAECLRVFPRAPISTDGQERLLCDALLEGPVSPPASEDQLERDRDDGSAAWSRRSVVSAVLALFGQCSDVWATRPHTLPESCRASAAASAPLLQLVRSDCTYQSQFVVVCVAHPCRAALVYKSCLRV